MMGFYIQALFVRFVFNIKKNARIGTLYQKDNRNLDTDEK